MTTDPTLLEPLRRGDEAAFRAAYELEKSCIYGLLLHLCGNDAEAADLFQNVWLKLAKHHRKLRADTNLRAWLCRVARNEWLSLRRAQRVDMSRVFTLGLLGSPQHDSNPTVERLDLLHALETLNDADREVLVMNSFSELTPEEMGSVLGVNLPTVRQRLSRARRRFQKALQTPGSALDDAEEA
jgi:RNA polymerase sigma-70 factor (ECF subfamily)